MNKLADYGSIVMVFLVHQKHALVSARDIAMGTHLGLPTVSKILKRLTAAGLLKSVRGASGGYALKRLAAEISVVDILYALDTSRGLTACRLSPDACVLHSVCHVKANWQLISQSIEAALESISLEALAASEMSSDTLNQMKTVVMGVSCVEST